MRYGGETSPQAGYPGPRGLRSATRRRRCTARVQWNNANERQTSAALFAVKVQLSHARYQK